MVSPIHVSSSSFLPWRLLQHDSPPLLLMMMMMMMATIIIVSYKKKMMKKIWTKWLFSPAKWQSTIQNQETQIKTCLIHAIVWKSSNIFSVTQRRESVSGVLIGRGNRGKQPFLSPSLPSCSLQTSNKCFLNSSICSYFSYWCTV